MSKGVIIGVLCSGLSIGCNGDDAIEEVAPPADKAVQSPTRRLTMSLVF